MHQAPGPAGVERSSSRSRLKPLAVWRCLNMLRTCFQHTGRCLLECRATQRRAVGLAAVKGHTYGPSYLSHRVTRRAKAPSSHFIVSFWFDSTCKESQREFHGRLKIAIQVPIKIPSKTTQLVFSFSGFVVPGLGSEAQQVGWLGSWPQEHPPGLDALPTGRWQAPSTRQKHTTDSDGFRDRNFWIFHRSRRTFKDIRF